MLNITPEALETMRNFNTLTCFMFCIVFWAFAYGNLIYQIGYLIVTFVNFLIRKIKEKKAKKKGTDVDEENTHTEH